MSGWRVEWSVTRVLTGHPLPSSPWLEDLNWYSPNNYDSKKKYKNYIRIFLAFASISILELTLWKLSEEWDLSTSKYRANFWINFHIITTFSIFVSILWRILYLWLIDRGYRTIYDVINFNTNVISFYVPAFSQKILSLSNWFSDEYFAPWLLFDIRIREFCWFLQASHCQLPYIFHPFNNFLSASSVSMDIR